MAEPPVSEGVTQFMTMLEDEPLGVIVPTVGISILGGKMAAWIKIEGLAIE